MRTSDGAPDLDARRDPPHDLFSSASATMNIDQLWEIKRARPFRPLRIVLDDGRTFEVHAPQHWLVSAPMVVIGTDVDEADDLPRTTTMTHPSRVLRIDFLEDTATR